MRIEEDSVRFYDSFHLSGPCRPGTRCLELGNHSHMVHEEQVTWFEARDLCRSSGADLSVFSNLDMNTIIQTFKSENLAGHYWIGLIRAIWLSGRFVSQQVRKK